MSALHALVTASVVGFHAAGRPIPAPALRAPLAARISNVVLAEEAGAPGVANAYKAAGVASAVAWTGCALITLSVHPQLAVNAMCGRRHNVLTIAQALALPLPLAWAVITSLRSAAEVGWKRLASATYRRLNLGLAAASFWMAAAVFNMPAFATGFDMYPPLFKLAATAAHALTAVLCVGVWVRTVEPTSSGHYVPRIVRGLAGSVASLAPKGASDDPDAPAGRDGRAEYALCAALFAWFAALAVVSPFPMATVPSILGSRLSRAASGWVFLAAVVSYVLKDATERGRAAASTFVTLRNGLRLGCGLHLLILVSKLVGIDGGGLLLPGRGLWLYYRNMMAVPFTAAVAGATHALALFVTSTTPPEGEAAEGK